MKINVSLEELLTKLINANLLVYTVLSFPRKKVFVAKVTIRPIQLKEGWQYQITTYQENQAFHRNVDGKECRDFLLQELQNNFKRALLCTKENDYQILISEKKQISILKKPPTHTSAATEHNLSKSYILKEGIPHSFLIELGIMSREGKVSSKKNDKFRQINRFLEFIRDVLSNFDPQQTLNIVDFGCGKAYLTFALYHFLVNIEGRRVNIQGLDLKSSVIKECRELAAKLEYKHLKFTQGDISHYAPEASVDLVISLHACDTATDAALAQAIKWKTPVILCVPCCQKELFQQIHNDALKPLLKHGILKERFAALVTDAARAQLLDIAGYQTQVLEFIDLEHTPKNLLIRAVKRSSEQSSPKAKENYGDFTELLGIHPFFEQFIIK